MIFRYQEGDLGPAHHFDASFPFINDVQSVKGCKQETSITLFLYVDVEKSGILANPQQECRSAGVLPGEA